MDLWYTKRADYSALLHTILFFYAIFFDVTIQSNSADA